MTLLVFLAVWCIFSAIIMLFIEDVHIAAILGTVSIIFTLIVCCAVLSTFHIQTDQRIEPSITVTTVDGVSDTTYTYKLK